MASLRGSPEIVDLTADHGNSTVPIAARNDSSVRRHANGFNQYGDGVEVIAIDDEPTPTRYKTDPNLRHTDKARKRKRPLLVSNQSDVVDLSNDGNVTLPLRNAVAFSIPSDEPESCFDQVIRVFPDVDHKYLHNLLVDYGNNVAVVVSLLADSTSYPKANNVKPAPHAAPLAFVQGEAKKWTYEFMSMGSFETQKMGLYRQQSLVQLLIDCKCNALYCSFLLCNLMLTHAL